MAVAEVSFSLALALTTLTGVIDENRIKLRYLDQQDADLDHEMEIKKHAGKSLDQYSQG
jgi:hypothetical protein